MQAIKTASKQTAGFQPSICLAVQITKVLSSWNETFRATDLGFRELNVKVLWIYEFVRKI